MWSSVDFFIKCFLGCVHFKDTNSSSLEIFTYNLTTTLSHDWQLSKEDYHVYTTLNFLHAFVYRIYANQVKFVYIFAQV